MISPETEHNQQNHPYESAVYLDHFPLILLLDEHPSTTSSYVNSKQAIVCENHDGGDIVKCYLHKRKDESGGFSRSDPKSDPIFTNLTRLLSIVRIQKKFKRALRKN
ncbi:hypothetical protein QVD17_02024 [Tagetes erecta]|uniref:Uncharacterized protein n=1 Tax=Tagetes erecta TaxID=13708 RepID=A0AAD8P209_TARER|nr:hypothetical protein QVD17_02024 [Tagetes erecta]